MDTSHRVRRQTYEVTLARGDHAHSLQERVRRTHRDFVLPGLVDVLDAVDDTMDTIVLDRVELELGSIEEGALETQLVSRMIDALRDVLTEQLPRISSVPTGSEGGQRIPPERVDLEALDVFLSTGRMPWWRSDGAGSSVDALLGRVLAGELDALRLRLRAGPRQLIARRLAKQFSATSIGSLLRALAGAHAEAVDQVIVDWIRAARGTPSIRERVDNEEHAIHARTIEHLIAGSDDAPGVSRMLLGWLARELAMDERRLAADLIRGGRGSEPQPATRSAWLEA